MTTACLSLAYYSSVLALAHRQTSAVSVETPPPPAILAPQDTAVSVETPPPALAPRKPAVSVETPPPVPAFAQKPAVSVETPPPPVRALFAPQDPAVSVEAPPSSVLALAPQLQDSVSQESFADWMALQWWNPLVCTFEALLIFIWMVWAFGD